MRVSYLSRLLPLLVLVYFTYVTLGDLLGTLPLMYLPNGLLKRLIFTKQWTGSAQVEFTETLDIVLTR